MASASGASAVSATSASKEKLNASGSTPDSSPTRTPTVTTRVPGRRRASASTVSSSVCASESSCIGPSMVRHSSPLANARQLVAAQHIHKAAGAEPRAQNHFARPAVGHRADELGAGAQRVGAQGRQERLGDVGGDDGDELAFVGDVERVQAQELAGAMDFFAHRDGGLLDADADAGLCGDFVQGGGQAAAGRVAPAANRAADGGEGRHPGGAGPRGGGGGGGRGGLSREGGGRAPRGSGRAGSESSS